MFIICISDESLFIANQVLNRSCRNDQTQKLMTLPHSAPPCTSPQFDKLSTLSWELYFVEYLLRAGQMPGNRAVNKDSFLTELICE